MDLPAHTKWQGARIARRLEEIATLPGGLGTRCQGMLAAVEPCAEHFGKTPARVVGAEAEARGVFFRVIDSVLAIAPPYIITEAEIDFVMDVMRDAILTASCTAVPAPGKPAV